MEQHDNGPARAVDRRTVLRRAAVTGGAVVWTAPVVQSLASPAFAAGSPLCDVKVVVDNCVLTYQESPDCCQCIEDAAAANPNISLADALAGCSVCGTPTKVCGKQDRNPPPPERAPGTQGVPTVIPAGE